MTINVTRSSMPEYEEYCQEIKDLWDNHWLTNRGVKHQQLEADLKDYLKVPNITLYTNGHLALENIIAVMGLSTGSEIITTPFTFASTTHAIVRSGCQPVFCDINPDNYTLDINKLEALITNKTKAILPVHVYGNICDIEAIQDIANEYNLKVIYDAAHAFGVTYKGISSASFGDASMFSFHATKVFNTIEGGAVSYANDSLAEILENLKNFGIKSEEEIVYIGGNAKMNEFQAAMGICNLRHLDTEIKKRQMVVEAYRTRLSELKGIKLAQEQKAVKSNYAYFPVVFDGYKYSRDEICDKLAKENIFARKYFYPLTSSFEAYHNKFEIQDTPIAKHISDCVLTLPLYADLNIAEVDLICELILR